MKKIFPLIVCLAVLCIGATSALASRGGFSPSPTTTTEGFSQKGTNLTTAKEAAQLRDDTKVVLRGNIVEHLGDDNYIFKDASGIIQMEIDDDKWRGQGISPMDLVEIHGEVDRDWNGIEIEVDRIVKLQ